MTSTLDDEDLALSIPTPAARRSSAHPTPGSSQQAGEKPKGGIKVIREEHKEQKERTSQRLGQYTIVKTLGEGSFGKVKLAIHDVSKQPVALKIISRRKLVTRDMAGRIEREIQYLQLLRHPHIIKL